jgi:hypothetical protein
MITQRINDFFQKLVAKLAESLIGINDRVSQKWRTWHGNCYSYAEDKRGGRVHGYGTNICRRSALNWSEREKCNKNWLQTNGKRGTSEDLL